MAGIAVLLLVLLLASFGVAAYGVSIYNGLVQVKRQVERAWSNIDVLLKQRHDELPKLLDAVKGYMTHERALLNEVTALRARRPAQAQIRVTNASPRNRHCRRAFPSCFWSPRTTRS